MKREAKSSLFALTVMVFCFLQMALFHGTGPSFSNDTTIGFTGGSAYPLENRAVRLLKEVLVVELSEGDATVEVTYTMKNEGTQSDVTMGFPYFSEEDLVNRDSGDYALDVKDFQCKADGRAVAVTRKKGPNILQGKDSSFKSTSWKTWKLSFGEGQERTVWHRYRAYMGSSLSSTSTFRAVSFLEYILTTARNWKGGTIGEFTLTVIPVAPLRNSDIYGINMVGFKDEEGKLRLDLKNFAPSKELFIAVYSGYAPMPLAAPSAWLNPSFMPRAPIAGMIPDSSRRLLTEFDLKGKTARELTLIRNEIYARHGRPFKDQELKKYFDSMDWYVPDENYREALLTDVEKKNAAYILEYQKKKGLTW
ncbi:MAG: YARHG domain-containing protein [Candidatus Eremiobacteraeota bacterium]|nr:YARHG domain-containing protein [Candidatus Eremiobacteraeota bacterium]